MAKTFPADMSELAELLEKLGISPQDASSKFGVNKRTLYRWVKEGSDMSGYSLLLKELRKMVKLANKSKSGKDEPDFKYIDLFAGIGGFRKAFDSVNGECVFTSEWDKACRLTYQANNECDHPVVGDIRDYTKDEESLALIPKHHLLVGGFPCQPFSIAGVSKKNSLGKSHGFKCDTQGTLFFDLAQIIERHQPPAILLENVKNLVSHDQGKTFKIIQRTLKEELGYTIDYRVIDGRYWVPQHRERIFIIGFKGDVGFDFKNFQLPENNPTLQSILHSDFDQEETLFYVNGQVDPKYTLSPRLWEYLQEYREKHKAKGNGFGFSLFGPDDVARTLSARYYKDGSEILIKQQGKKRPRRLTPRECSRLMGFDAPYQSDFIIPVSDTQAYRQFGNSVIVPLATAIAEYMKPYIMEAIRVNDKQLNLPFPSPRKRKKQLINV